MDNGRYCRKPHTERGAFPEDVPATHLSFYLAEVQFVLIHVKCLARFSFHILCVYFQQAHLMFVSRYLKFGKKTCFEVSSYIYVYKVNFLLPLFSVCIQYSLQRVICFYIFFFKCWVHNCKSEVVCLKGI